MVKLAFALGRHAMGNTVHIGLKDFRNEFFKYRLELTTFQRLLLGTGSSLMCLADPRRADMIAIMGETTGIQALKSMLNMMENNAESADIIRGMPRINSVTVDLDKLASLPKGTVGNCYVTFLKKYNITPDSRNVVRCVDDLKLAYVIQRYREIHDLVHALLDMPTNMLGEVTVKWVEAFQTKLPLCVFGGLFGAMRLAPKQRKKYVERYLPWAIETGLTAKPFLNVYFEKRWEQPVDDLLKELEVKPLSK